MFVKPIKSLLLILFLVFAFIDAANIVDLFSNTEVIHFDEGSPDSQNFSCVGISLNNGLSSSIDSSAKTFFGVRTKKKSSLPKLLIYDQDSPSVVHEVQVQEESITKVEPADNVVPLDQSVSRIIYIENCRLQI